MVKTTTIITANLAKMMNEKRHELVFPNLQFETSYACVYVCMHAYTYSST